MATQDDEFLISQYLDGTLPADVRANVAEHLAADAVAAGTLSDYRRIDTALRAHARLPDLQWDRLTEHLSTQIDLAEAEEEVRLAPLPMRRNAFGWAAELASVAAAVVIGVVLFRGATQPQAPGARPAVVEVAIGAFPAASPGNRVVLEVALGTPPAGAIEEDFVAVGLSEVIAGEPRVVAASDSRNVRRSDESW